MSRTNPQTNPMAPMGSTGIPVTKMGSVTMVDWSALSSPANRTSYGMAPMQPEPSGPADKRGLSFPQPISALADDLNSVLRQTFGDSAIDKADGFLDNIQDVIASWAASKPRRRGSSTPEFEQAIVTAVGETIKGTFVGGGRAFVALLKVLDIPAPERESTEKAFDDFVAPVVNRVAPLVGAIFGSTKGDAEIVRVYAEERAAENRGVDVSKEVKRRGADVRGRLAERQRESAAEFKNRLKAAGVERGLFDDDLSENARLYRSFKANMASFAQREADRLEAQTFGTVPIGLEAFAVEDPQTKAITLTGRFYSAEQQAAIDLSTPGMFTREEITERLQSDPGLVDAARGFRGGGDGRYLTPETVLDENGIIRTLAAMLPSELYSLKNTMARLYGMDVEDIGDPTIRRIDQPTIDNFSKLVRNAQENGYTWNGWIDYATDKNMFLGKAAPQRQAPLIRVTSPTDLKAVANRVAQQTIGYQLDEGELEQFVASYQDMERRSQMRAAGGGTVASAPTAATAAEEMITGGARKAEADAFAVGNTIDVMRQIMTGGMR
jgi:hypothetical protein